MKTVTNKRAVKIKKTGAIVPAGTKLTVEFTYDSVRRRDMMILTVIDTGEQFKSVNYPNYFRTPSIATMTKWSNDGIAKSVTGGRCECDGHSCDNAPSWMLALGYI